MDKQKTLVGCILNAILILLGVIMLFFPATSLSWIIVLVAILLIAYAVVSGAIFFLNKNKQDKKELILPGILLVVGILLWIFSYPLAYVLFPLIIGAYAVLNGIFIMIDAFSLKKLGVASWWVPAVIAAVYFIIGVIIVSNLLVTSAMISIFLGIMFVVYGLIGICSIGTIHSFRKKYNL